MKRYGLDSTTDLTHNSYWFGNHNNMVSIGIQVTRLFLPTNDEGSLPQSYSQRIGVKLRSLTVAWTVAQDQGQGRVVTEQRRGRAVEQRRLVRCGLMMPPGCAWVDDSSKLLFCAGLHTGCWRGFMVTGHEMRQLAGRGRRQNGACDTGLEAARPCCRGSKGARPWNLCRALLLVARQQALGPRLQVGRG